MCYTSMVKVRSPERGRGEMNAARARVRSGRWKWRERRRDALHNHHGAGGARQAGVARGTLRTSGRRISGMPHCSQRDAWAGRGR